MFTSLEDRFFSKQLLSNICLKNKSYNTKFTKKKIHYLCYIYCESIHFSLNKKNSFLDFSIGLLYFLNFHYLMAG